MPFGCLRERDVENGENVNLEAQMAGGWRASPERAKRQIP